MPSGECDLARDLDRGGDLSRGSERDLFTRPVNELDLDRLLGLRSLKHMSRRGEQALSHVLGMFVLSREPRST